jgi:hypothetical protein
MTFRPIYHSWALGSNRSTGSQQLPMPTQFIPQYPGGSRADIQSYLRAINQMTTGRGFDFQAQPVTFNDVRARQVSAQAAVDMSLGSNEANEARFAGMAQRLTEADTATRMQMLDQFVPQWRTQRDTAAAINQAYMQGEVPRDVANKLQRDAAFMGLASGGYQGGANIRSVTARDLGLTSLDLQQRGMAGAERWTGLMANLMPEQTTAAGVMATQGMTPQMALETSLQNAANQLQADITTSQGRMEAGYRTQDIGLRAAIGRSAAEQGWAGMRAEGLGTALQASTSERLNQFIAASQASDIQFANLYRPYAFQQELAGLRSGQGQRAGFGL